MQDHHGDSGGGLPIDEVLGALRESLAGKNRLVLVAEPGAGKTTRVPLALREAAWLNGQKILMLEPRRLAAQSAAAYMASLLGEGVGGQVGYRVRGDTKVSPRTVIEVVTEGILTRMLQHDASLDGYGAVLFDEFHERSVHSDVGLALALQSQETLRPDLRLLVMSATMDSEAVATVMGGAPLIHCPGRTYPVATIYADAKPQSLIVVMELLIKRAVREQVGDVLAFLPGRAEIFRAEEQLQALAESGIVIHKLYGEAPFEAQRAAIEPDPQGRRKVILATSIAETSLTIKGVRTVVDSGLMRSSRFDPNRGMPSLVTTSVSRASADQRRGRAGRECAGVCYRAWTVGEEAAFPRFSAPEILHTDLASLALELAAWGVRDARALAMLDHPSPGALEGARTLLQELGALDHEGAITAHGRSMAELGVHPRLAHMILWAEAHGAAGVACDIAALLEERDPLRGDKGDVDLSRRYEALLEWRNDRRKGQRSFARIDQQAQRLRKMLSKERAAKGDLPLGALCAVAFPDRIGQRRDAHGKRYLLSNGSGVELPAQSMLGRSEYLVVVELEGSAAHARVFLAEPIAESTLRTTLSHLIKREIRSEWDEKSEEVVAREEERISSVVLSSSRIKLDPEEASRTLLRHVAPRVTIWFSDAARNFQLRSEWVRGQGLMGPDWPDLSDGYLIAHVQEWLLPFVNGKVRARQLEELDYLQALKARFSYEQLRALDRLAPSTLALPSGAQVAIRYELNAPATLSVYLQEMFGQKETPRIGDGKTPLVVELLSPARRPLQITKDLSSFWQNAYKEVRKEMLGRYPKHFWPEDPLNAPPIKRKPRIS